MCVSGGRWVVWVWVWVGRWVWLYVCVIQMDCTSHLTPIHSHSHICTLACMRTPVSLSLHVSEHYSYASAATLLYVLQRFQRLLSGVFARHPRVGLRSLPRVL